MGGDLKVKYEGSTLGYLWSVLEPLMLTAVYFFVFSVVTRFGDRLKPYALFLISGILPWQWVTAVVKGSSRSLMGNASLITKVHVPREIFPLSVVASKTIEFLLSLFVLGFFAAVYRVGPSVYLLAFPLAVLLQLVLLTGVALILAPANTLLRDIERVIGPLLRALFYLSPILYPLTTVMESGVAYPFKVLYRLNPMVGILELYRAVWYPESFQGWANVGIAALGAAGTLALGWILFARLERAVLKEL